MPVTSWQLKQRSLNLCDSPLWMGILNVTPDSFSDGGRHAGVEAAVQHARQLIADGADIIDIGGESTRPYSQAVDVQEELARVIPVIRELRRESDIPISIDTSKAVVASQAMEAGADIINDVTGLESDPGMIEVARETGAGICAMHMQGTPQTMQDHPNYDNVVEDIYQYLLQRKTALLSAGIDRERICLDPGIGFGKTHQHNLDLIAGIARFHDLECPILAGHSRKGFIGTVLNDRELERDSGTAGVSLALALQGIQILRVHHVGWNRRAWSLFQAVGKGQGPAIRLA